MTAAECASQKPTKEIENPMFSIVRWFFLILALCAIVSAITLLGIAARDYFFTSFIDKNISVKNYSYNDYVTENSAASQNVATQADEANKPSNAVKAQEEQIKREQEKLEFEKQLDVYIRRIMTSLTTYATALGDPAPAEAPLHDNIKGIMDAIAREYPEQKDMQWVYVKGLTEACEGLATHAQEVAKYGVGDSRRVDFTKFIDWYNRRFGQQLNGEEARINSAISNANMQKMMAIPKAIAAGAAFGSFVLFTMLLVLLRIERNTRPAK